MILLLICVIINGLITTVFKLFGIYKVDTMTAITTNYFVCVLTGIAVSGNTSHLRHPAEQDWIWYAVALGFLLVLVFNILGKTVQEQGVVIGTIFQKMSLIAPALVAILFFNEPASVFKIVGLVLGIISIYYLSKGDTELDLLQRSLMLPFLTLIGSSMVDLSLFLVEVCHVAPGADIGFLSTSFLFAGFFGLALLIYRKIRTGFGTDLKSLAGGVILGIPNFFSIYLLLKVISLGYGGSMVFPINNVGVLLISALMGIFFFKEKMTKNRILGFSLAIGAIILLSINH